MPAFNTAQVLSATRSALAAAGGIAVALGWLHPADAAALADGVVGLLGAALSLGVLAWGIWVHSHANAIAEGAAAIDATPHAVDAMPVVEALRVAGAQVSTVGMRPKPAAPTPGA